MTDGCGTLGCRKQPDVVIDHPQFVEDRAVCETHAKRARRLHDADVVEVLPGADLDRLEVAVDA